MTLPAWNERAARAAILAFDDGLQPVVKAPARRRPHAEPILNTASRLGWTVVSMRRDWNRVFAG